MPRASINVELEDGDLRKFVEDMARRWTLNTIHDVIKHLRGPNLSGLVREVFTAVATGAAIGQSGQPPGDDEDIFAEDRQRPAHGHPAHPQGAPHPPPWGPGSPPWGPGAPPYAHGGPPPQPPPGVVDEILNRMPPDVPPRAPRELMHCIPVEPNQYQEEGWLCHECSFVNGSHRSVCRHCKHERCDDIVASKGGKPS